MHLPSNPFLRSRRSISCAGRFAAAFALVVSVLSIAPDDTTAQFAVTDAVDYGGGRYGVIASLFGVPEDGLVGNMTSSGRILEENDRLVALPACTESSCPWLPRGTDKSDPYGAQTSCAEADGLCWVQIYAPETGRCAVAPVLDRGPLFVMDNWWAATEERVYALPKGQPAAEIVRTGGTVGFGNGYSDRGYNVQRDFSFGPAIDLAAGTWADIGLSTRRMAVNVEVTLLWQAGISHEEACDGTAPSPSNAATTDDLNFRSGPGTTFDVLDVLATGTRVQVTGGSSNGFYPVEVAGTSGWVFGDYLTLDDGAAPDDTAAATVLEALNLRAGPSTADEILDVMPAGTTVTLLGDSDSGFASVQVGGLSGWAYAVYLEVNGQSLADDTATVREDLNFRAGPSLTSEILDVMPVGATVTLTGNGENGFVSVIYQGESGWAHEDYLD